MAVSALSAATFAAGIVDSMMGTYDDLVTYQQSTNLPLVMQLDVPATTRSTRFAYWDTPPGLAYWEQGSRIPRGGMRSTAWDTPVFPFGRSIEWQEDDRNDDQLQGLQESAMRAGESAAYLAEEFAFDILTNTASVLPSIPLAPDGAALFAPTAGGMNRFGVAGGNTLSGNGVASVDAVLTDYFNGRTRWARMTHRGSRLVPDALINAGILILFGPQNEKVFGEAFLTSRIAQGSAGATPENVVKTAGHRVTLWMHPRITDNTWIMVLTGAKLKPLYELIRQPLRETIHTVETSPAVSKDGIESVDFKMRSGAGANLPWMILRVSN